MPSPVAGVLALALFVAGCAASAPPAPSAAPTDVTEATIAEVHAAMRAGTLTSRALVEAYLARIAAYDLPDGLNALTVVNAGALARADALDAEVARTGVLRPLHGIPLVVKDNYDTADLQTAAGSLALKGAVAPDDAFQVRRLREAGAIVLAKSNMAEWAFSPVLTESSIGGVTRNPYDLDRVPAGSSGGTAAAVSANLGMAGLGTDTGNSIRGPSSHTALVGIRSSMGLTSRDGIVPLFLRNDIGGPMTRTVEDGVRLLDVIAGVDPADPITARAAGRPASYLPALDLDGLRGRRVGVFRRYLVGADPEVAARTEQALRDLAAQGAVLVDPFDVPDFEALTEGIWCATFRQDLDAYLATRGATVRYRSLQEVVDSGLYLGSNAEALASLLAEDTDPAEREPPCIDVFASPRNIAFRDAVEGAMAAADLDAIVYPTWSHPPRLVGDLESPHGDNSQLLSPHTGLPAITVPSGFTAAGLPTGLTFVGEMLGEEALIGMAYAYEQATRHRRPPSGFPALD
ncbi:amidase [Rubrivirga sp. IMCC43871]|uniref:amidase n=1 Tax=Rubrivirga sp. IMCC43871 TaxID=3391575 RepID=UPI00398FCE0D